MPRLPVSAAGSTRAARGAELRPSVSGTVGRSSEDVLRQAARRPAPPAMRQRRATSLAFGRILRVPLAAPSGSGRALAPIIGLASPDEQPHAALFPSLRSAGRPFDRTVACRSRGAPNPIGHDALPDPDRLHRALAVAMLPVLVPVADVAWVSRCALGFLHHERCHRNRVAQSAQSMIAPVDNVDIVHHYA